MSLTKYDGGSAYPFGLNYPGLSIRDWFAGQVLAGIYSDPDVAGDSKYLASFAYDVADAMIARKHAIEAEENEGNG